jgi:hypothetical protein
MKDNKQIILHAFAASDARIEELKNHSIRSAVANIASVIAVASELAINELADLNEEQVLDRAQRRAKMLASL